MKAKFITVKGSEHLGHEPFYLGILQHERTMSRKEAYEYIAGRTGYTATAVRAVFMAVAEYIRENQARGNVTYIDGVASIRNYVRGSFDGLAGPWVKGRNVLMVNAVELEPFKTVLGAVVPENNTEGAKPVINTVLDETTRVYDEITGTDVFSIAGANLAPDHDVLRLAERQGASRSGASCRGVHAQGLHAERSRRPVRRDRRDEEGGGWVIGSW